MKSRRANRPAAKAPIKQPATPLLQPPKPSSPPSSPSPTAVQPAHVMVATPAYGGMLHVDYLNSLLTYQSADIQFTLTTIGNESLITRARNTLLSMFHVRPECTHLLFLDADVSLDAETLKDMLAQQRDVIGAPVALKGRNSAGQRIFNIGKTVGESGSQILVEHIGTAAFMLSRKAVNALVQDAVDDGRVYTFSKETLRGTVDGHTLMYDVFQVGVIDGNYLSEDYWVCRRLRELGFDIHVQPDAITQHHGTVAV